MNYRRIATFTGWLWIITFVTSIPRWPCGRSGGRTAQVVRALMNACSRACCSMLGSCRRVRSSWIAAGVSRHVSGRPTMAQPEQPLAWQMTSAPPAATAAPEALPASRVAADRDGLLGAGLAVWA